MELLFIETINVRIINFLRPICIYYPLFYTLMLFVVEMSKLADTTAKRLGMEFGTKEVCWLLAAGCWLLAAGCWLLAAGCWLLAAVYCLTSAVSHLLSAACCDCVKEYAYARIVKHTHTHTHTHIHTHIHSHTHTDW
jgi:hypothetical protein